MSEEPQDAVGTGLRSIAVTVNDLGGRFMLHPETMAAGAAAGYSNGFAFYAAGRGGVLGDVDADVVTAGFGFFAPHIVRVLWEEGVQVEGARAAGRRYAEVCAQWGRSRLAGFDGAARLASLSERVLHAASPVGLALFAAWRAEPLPEDAAGRCYQLLHVMREWRGSAHVVGVAAAGLDPLTAVFSKGGAPQAKMFGWSEPFPDAIDPALADRVRLAEDITDSIWAPAFDVLSTDEVEEFVVLVAGAKATLDTA
jgi:hypothetical protein